MSIDPLALRFYEITESYAQDCALLLGTSLHVARKRSDYMLVESLGNLGFLSAEKVETFRQDYLKHLKAESEVANLNAEAVIR